MNIEDIRALLAMGLHAIGDCREYSEATTVDAGGGVRKHEVKPADSNTIWIFTKLIVMHNEGGNETLYYYQVSGGTSTSLWWVTATTDTLYYPLKEMGELLPVVVSSTNYPYIYTSAMTAGKALTVKGTYHILEDVDQLLRRHV